MKIEIFTDGTYDYSTGESISSYVILLNGRVISKYIEILQNRTQNYAELYAVTHAMLKVYKMIDIDDIKSISVYSDSENSIDLITRFTGQTGKEFLKNSKKFLIKNQECIRIIDVILKELKPKGIDVNFYHILSHSTSYKKRYFAYKRFITRYNKDITLKEYERLVKYNNVSDWILKEFRAIYKN